MKLPEVGQGWRHHEGALYEIVGLAINTDTHGMMVVYQPWGLTRTEAQLMSVSRLDEFLGVTPDYRYRFAFERAE